MQNIPAGVSAITVQAGIRTDYRLPRGKGHAAVDTDVCDKLVVCVLVKEQPDGVKLLRSL